MLVEITSAEAQLIHIKVEREHRYLTSDRCWWLGTQAELRAEIALQAALLTKMEAVIRAAGHWEAHAERLAILRKAG